MILGAWLATSALVFNYADSAIPWNDVVAGAVIFGISSLALAFPKYAWITYGNALVGIWLLLPPLFFWAPHAATYLNDSLIGTLVIVFSIVIPMSSLIELLSSIRSGHRRPLR